MYKYSEYDYGLLRQAYDLIEKVYNYNYDSSSQIRQLDTIRKKLDAFLKCYERQFGEVPTYNVATGKSFPNKNNRGFTTECIETNKNRLNIMVQRINEVNNPNKFRVTKQNYIDAIMDRFYYISDAGVRSWIHEYFGTNIDYRERNGHEVNERNMTRFLRSLSFKELKDFYEYMGLDIREYLADEQLIDDDEIDIL